MTSPSLLMMFLILSSPTDAFNTSGGASPMLGRAALVYISRDETHAAVEARKSNESDSLNEPLPR